MKLYIVNEIMKDKGVHLFLLLSDSISLTLMPEIERNISRLCFI